MTESTTCQSEADILRRFIKPEQADLSPDAARGILALDFDPVDRERMQELALRPQQGELTPTEQAEIERYRRVGYFLDVLRSKARQSLRQSGSSA